MNRLNNPPVCEAHRVVSEHRFRLDGLINTEIGIRIYERLDGSGFGFMQSHYVHAPHLAGPYRTSLCEGHGTAEEALRTAAGAIVDYYEAGIKKGHEPDESWLVPEEDY